MTIDEFEAFSARAYDYLEAQQQSLESKFRLKMYPRYDFSQETCQVVWSDGGIARVVADVQIVGSYSMKSGTWLWAWANSNILDSVCEDIDDVRQFGEKHDILSLTLKNFPAEENDGWRLTAVAAFILRSVGAYCPVEDDVLIFMVISDIRFADEYTI